jgi:hypothetical protein
MELVGTPVDEFTLSTLYPVEDRQKAFAPDWSNWHSCMSERFVKAEGEIAVRAPLALSI